MGRWHPHRSARPWGAPADLDTKATWILEAFSEQPNWPANYMDYLAGLLPPHEAKDCGFRPEINARAVEIMAVLGDDNNMTILNNGLRRIIGGARKPRRHDRLEPLVELMLRPLRGVATPSEISIARTILSKLREMGEWNCPAGNRSRLALDELYGAACNELKAGHSAQPRRFILDLAFMAVFWLARHGALRRQREDKDQREPEQLLRLLMHSEHGLAIFRQAVLDGRAGIAPRGVRADLTIAKDATDAEVPITTEWLKDTFPDSASANTGLQKQSYQQLLADVRQSIRDMRKKLAELTNVAQTLGVEPPIVTEIRGELQEASDELAILSKRWIERNQQDRTTVDS